MAFDMPAQWALVGNFAFNYTRVQGVPGVWWVYAGFLLCKDTLWRIRWKEDWTETWIAGGLLAWGSFLVRGNNGKESVLPRPFRV